ncbi:hypothetical protein R3I94_018225 [Phoxinus phoxinus]
MALQLFGYIMSITGLCGLILATFTNEWKTIGHDNDETVFLDEYEGLWMKCTISSSSFVQCIRFNTLLHQAFEIRLARVMMITSMVFSSLGAIVAIFGLGCTRCLDKNKQSKDRAAFAGGILSVCSGLFALGITSWIMYGIVDDFFQEDKKARYVIGWSLIGAFAASLLCLFGGVLLCACSLTHLRSNTNLSKRPVSKIPGKDYV